MDTTGKVSKQPGCASSWRAGSKGACKKVMKPIFIGIMPQEKIRERVLAIASGTYQPQPDEPKVWFVSMKSLAEVLSDENRALLHVMMEMQPESISALAEVTGRKQSNLSRTLKTMSPYGIVELKRERNQVRPVAKATEFRIVAQ
ncbi:transcriptional regulator [Janthinobacterium sp.]|uniref:HVO_A0114 family putative DNA-binding protein n=1 Tax=Janthinobacterium sp. TaxID=1871054 RepID=UPI0028A108F3|nr:transcriptional regulator [Janthinobacterium sp.]